MRKPPRHLDEITAAALLRRIDATLPTPHVVILSDYAKGVLCDAVLAALLELIAAHGKPVIADPKRPDFRAYRGVTVLTPNELEVRVATHIDAAFDAEADRAGCAALEVHRRRGRAGHPLGQRPDLGPPRQTGDAFPGPRARGRRRLRRR